MSQTINTVANSSINNKRVTINIENADIHEVLQKLFQSVNANYSLNSEIHGNISLSLTNVPFPIALNKILSSSESQRLSYQLENGVYIVFPEAKPATVLDVKVTSADKLANTPNVKTDSAKVSLLPIAGDNSNQAQIGLMPSRLRDVNNQMIATSSTPVVITPFSSIGGYGNGYYNGFTGYQPYNPYNSMYGNFGSYPYSYYNSPNGYYGLTAYQYQLMTNPAYYGGGLTGTNTGVIPLVPSPK
jgi:hypothetical protein